ncbi:hypothetical protein [Streptomyces cinerochromogenes]|uniref:hypothetical protein n=1 Tax=Streptomyces cinerochromogenes TaxID=66422 RepID=UPI00166F9AFA|nr:hypothetical protein [Streptomyces cinerochromogenes]GGS69077.1 hypothetical protein GCM10010206_34120 [Streptomyces cinerochromogenes]
MPGGNDHEQRPESALEEVLREVEEAEKRDEEKAATGTAGHGTDDAGQADDGTGEAGDAITPNTGAQEQANGD